MKIGYTVTKGPANKHLDNDQWIELFPEGYSDIQRLARIQRCDKTFCDGITRNAHTNTFHGVRSGQTPILVRLTAWERVKNNGK